MKKIFLIPLLIVLFLTGCSSNSTSQKIAIQKPIENKITKQNEYFLDCKTKYFTGITIGGSIIKESYIKISEGHERDTLYVNGSSAKFFGADYTVLQDDTSYLIIMRKYSTSGLTEIVSINKESGIGFDTKTLTFGLSGAPNTDTYILSCS